MLEDAVGKTIESITSDTDGTTATLIAEASDPFAMPFLVEVEE